MVRSKGAYSVPRDLADCIAFVGGVSHFPVVSCATVRPAQSKQLTMLFMFCRIISSLIRAQEKSTTPPQNQIVNPEVIRQQYNITVSSGTNETSSQVGLDVGAVVGVHL